MLLTRPQFHPIALRGRASPGRLLAVLLGLALLAVSLPAANAGEWPGWRGGAREGRGTGPPGPIHWSPDRGVVWKSALPGEGHSSPIVTSDAVYVTTALRVESNARLLAAVQIALPDLYVRLEKLRVKIAAGNLETHFFQPRRQRAGARRNIQQVCTRRVFQNSLHGLVNGFVRECGRRFH